MTDPFMWGMRHTMKTSGSRDAAADNAWPPVQHRLPAPADRTAEDALTPQEVAEYAVWYARKVKGPAAEVARLLLLEFPWLREPLEAAALSPSAGRDVRDETDEEWRERRRLLGGVEVPSEVDHGA